MGWFIVIGFVALMAFVIWLAARSAAKDKAAGIIASFADLKLTKTHVIVGGRDSTKRYPLGGARAEVESAGDLSKRITATRLLATGVVALAWRKRKDDRSVFLTVEGPGVSLIREVQVKDNENAQVQARSFAVRLNSAAAQLAKAGPVPTSAAVVSAAARDLGAQLAELAGLRDTGALSEAEFAKAKARLLGTDPNPRLGGPEDEGPREGSFSRW
jgi:hypothetical protein